MVGVATVTVPVLGAQVFRLEAVFPALLLEPCFDRLARRLVRLVQVGDEQETSLHVAVRSLMEEVVSWVTPIAARVSVGNFVTCSPLSATQMKVCCDVRAVMLPAHPLVGSTRLSRPRVGGAWARARP